MKNKFVLLLAIVLGLVAAFGTFKYMEGLEQSYKLSGNYTQIAVAKQHIRPKTVLTKEMLELKEMPAEYVLPGTVVDLKDAEGKITQGDIFPGEVILRANSQAKMTRLQGFLQKLRPIKGPYPFPPIK